MASCFRNTCAKNRQNPLVLFKVTIDNVGVPFLRHSVESTHISTTGILKGLCDPIHDPFQKRGLVRTVSGNIHVKFEVRSLDHFGDIGI